MYITEESISAIEGKRQLLWHLAAAWLPNITNKNTGHTTKFECYINDE